MSGTHDGPIGPTFETPPAAHENAFTERDQALRDWEVRSIGRAIIRGSTKRSRSTRPAVQPRSLSDEPGNSEALNGSIPSARRRDQHPITHRTINGELVRCLS